MTEPSASPTPTGAAPGTPASSGLENLLTEDRRFPPSAEFAALGSLILQLIILGVLRFGITAEEHTSSQDDLDLPAAEIQALADTGD